MTLRQLHYTYVPPGPKTPGGFRFAAVDPVLANADLGQVEQLMGYEPPPSLPRKPSADGDARLPVTLSYTWLAGGGAMLCRSRYLGRELGGFHGNFHTHALHLEHGTDDLAGILPIETWDSPDWWSPEPGARLRVVPLTTLRDGGGAIARGLVDFARLFADRVEPFLADVYRLFTPGPGRQIVIVSWDVRDVVSWIALACASLPRALAARLSFTTYTRRPRQAPQQIIGITPDADIDLTDTELHHRYRVHDLVDGYSSPPLPDARAARIVVVWRRSRTPDEGLIARIWQDVAAVAAEQLVEGVGLDDASLDAAAAWAARHPGAYDDAFWKGLLAIVTDQEARLSDERVEDLRQALAEQHREAIDELCYRRAKRLLARAIVGDPVSASAGLDALGAGLSAESRRRIGQELGDDLRGALVVEQPYERLVTLFDFAGRFGVDCAPLTERLTALLTAVLLSSRPAAARCAEVLAETQTGEVRTAVWRTLDEHAAEDPRWARDRLRPVAAGRFTRIVPPDFPSLRVVLRAARSDPAVWGRDDATGLAVTLVESIVGDGAPPAEAGRRDAPNRPSALAAVFRLVWGDERIPAEDALRLVADVPGRLVDGPVAEAVCHSVIEADAVDEQVLRLAAVALPWQDRLSEPSASALRLVTSVARGGGLDEALREWPTTRQPSPAMRVWLSETVMGSLFEAGAKSAPWLAELPRLLELADPVLLRAYADRAAAVGLHRTLRYDAHTTARCLMAWLGDDASVPEWPGIRERLLQIALRPQLGDLNQLASVDTALRHMGASDQVMDAWSAWSGRAMGWRKRRAVKRADRNEPAPPPRERYGAYGV